MNFSKYFAFIAILVLCLTASSEAGFGKKFKHAMHKAGHKIDSAGKHAAHTIHKTAEAAGDVGKIAAAGAIIGGVAA